MFLSIALPAACSLYSVARHVQKHMRLLSVVESLDNGKPIRESRDADVPIVIRHLYHHAGWAQLVDTEMANWKSIGEIAMMMTTMTMIDYDCSP